MAAFSKYPSVYLNVGRSAYKQKVFLRVVSGLAAFDDVMHVALCANPVLGMPPNDSLRLTPSTSPLPHFFFALLPLITTANFSSVRQDSYS